MRKETRVAFNQWLDRQAELNHEDREVVRSGKAFTVDPTVAQTLNDKQQESSEFLNRINIAPVTEMKGNKLGLGVSGPIASRTNTTTTDRATKDPTTLDEQGYECVQTNSDTHVTYGKLDTWAKFKDFQARLRNVIVKRQALDRVMIGFNGTSIAATSNLGTSPLLQDVNKGWLKHIRDYDAGSHVLAEGDEEANKIIIAAAGGDYKNLDALVFDAVGSLLPSWSAEDSELVAIMGRDLLHDKYFPLINSDLEPTETQAADLIIAAKRVGGLPAYRAPFFPAGSILVTRFDNLSIYEQEGKRRRTIVDNAKRDRIETYESSNDAYVVEDMDYALLIEHIQFGVTP